MLGEDRYQVEVQPALFGSGAVFTPTIFHAGKWRYISVEGVRVECTTMQEALDFIHAYGGHLPSEVNPYDRIRQEGNKS